MKIIGINAFHADSSACLIIDGKLISAVEEERFNRIKHWAGFPLESIKYCLRESNLNLSDIDHISINIDPKANYFKKILFLIKHRPSLKLIFNRFKKKKKYNSIREILNKEFNGSNFNGQINNIEHHYAHLSSAFHVSPFEESCILSVDGFGDFASTAWGYGKNNKIKIDNKIHFPHSLGIFYQALTQFLGFKNYGDEYKIMGLAPYGKPTYVNQLRKILVTKPNGNFELNLDYFKFHKENFNYRWENGKVEIEDLYTDKIKTLLGPERIQGEDLTNFHKDLAHSTQKIYEEAFLNILNNLYDKYQNDNLCIAGGCGMNSVANGKIKDNTKFKNIYVQAAAGDAGGAIGAAFATHYKISNKKRVFKMKHAYWGTSFNDNQILDCLKKNEKIIENQKCSFKLISKNNELNKIVANDISEGKVVGWFQGKMEWGPRALGNRSILGDPRRSDMKDILNLKIKRRESFRPFAPSILREHVSDWFENDDDVPFMMKVYQIKEDKRKNIPAVTHVDGSGRLQTVYQETNKKYYDLINEFYKLTNVPLVLNTSFNENEPIVSSPEEALSCFLRTKMDTLVMENYIIKRT
ncbi:carbamoyltransferase [Candidatus Pelagibacter sp.]|jgi:carbamoyltransferase|nr:carbamoyltransferase [Candidatus Pelagibacter sp.]|tara:strand:+ start:975 stop:2720 length:1746 start_codon:yes stop_codon:yes gene_type:complete